MNTRRFNKKAPSRVRAAFTLIELLTVIAIIAVLASLVLTAVSSARKKSRSVVCTFNLHQVSLAMNMYLDDFDGKRPGVADLVSDKYLLLPGNLLCPEDKTGDWGHLSEHSPFVFTGFSTAVPAPVESAKYSYLFPLSLSSGTWENLMDEGDDAGIAACQLHGLGKQDPPDVHNYSGLLLRAQRDGSVVRRQFFWNTSVVPAFVIVNASVIPSGGMVWSVSDFYLRLQFFVDDPAHLLQATP